MKVRSTNFTSSSAKCMADDFPNFSLRISGELKQHFLIDLDIPKENKSLAAKKTSYFSAINNSSVKTVRKLQVSLILSSDKLPIKMKQSSDEINKGFSTWPALT